MSRFGKQVEHEVPTCHKWDSRAGFQSRNVDLGIVSTADSMTRRDLAVKLCRTDSKNPKDPLKPSFKEQDNILITLRFSLAAHHIISSNYNDYLLSFTMQWILC